MYKIQEEFGKWYNKGDYCFPENEEIYENEWEEAQRGAYFEGHKSADLLPTEKVCPECGGSGTKLYYNLDTDEHTKGVCNVARCHKGKVQIYYTPEQYQEIKGKPYPDDALAWGWFQGDEYFSNGWEVGLYKNIKSCSYFPSNQILIVQTAQPAPPADYRPEAQ